MLVDSVPLVDASSSFERGNQSAALVHDTLLKRLSGCGAMAGDATAMATSTDAGRHPPSRSRSTARFTNVAESAPAHCGSSGGNWLPMSPAAAAPKSASTSA